MKHRIKSIIDQFFEKNFREEFSKFEIEKKYYLSLLLKWC